MSMFTARRGAVASVPKINGRCYRLLRRRHAPFDALAGAFPPGTDGGERAGAPKAMPISITVLRPQRSLRRPQNGLPTANIMAAAVMISPNALQAYVWYDA
jgi:hypothetical protein